MKGLTWGHLGWLVLSSILLAMQVSSDRPQTLNWEIPVNFLNGFRVGWINTQDFANTQLDKVSAWADERFDKQPQLSATIDTQCSIKLGQSSPLSLEEIARYRISGQITTAPYCKDFQGNNLYLVEGDRTFQVSPDGSHSLR